MPATSWTRTVALLLFLVALLAPSAAGAAGPAARELAITAAEVEVTIHRGGDERPDGTHIRRRAAWVEGRVTYRLARPATADDEIVLLDFAAFLQGDPKALDEVAYSNYVAGGPFDAGGTAVTQVDGVAAYERRGERRDLVLRPHVGATEITLTYTVDVPHRYWPFGCVRRRCSLSGALAPLPSAPAKGGPALPSGRVVVPVWWTVTRASLANAEPPTLKGVRPIEVVVIGGHPDRERHYPTIVWGPKWHRARELHRGVTITVLHERARPSGRVPHETFIQLRRDVAGHILEIARQAVDVLVLVERAPPVDTEVTVVQGPIRSQVAEAHPDVVLLSDQALEILPAARFTKFHEEAIARALLDDLVERSFRGRHSASVDLWLPGMVSFSLLGVWHQARALRDEFAPDILRNFTFVPAVDRFLYTQQASFSQAYFRGVEDAPPIRNHPRWFAHELPTGRRIHEKLTDTLGPDRLDRFYRRITADPSLDPIVAAERAYEHELDWFFDQWLGPYPSVDYAIVGVESRPDPAGGWNHAITVERAGEKPVIEPVHVLVQDRSDERHYLVWNGELAAANTSLQTEPKSGRHTWHLHTKERIEVVRLDPRARLVQTPQAPKDNVDPRFNDRKPPLFRFLYTGIGLSIAASEFVNANTVAARFNGIAGFATFEGSLARDLRRTGHVRISRDRETQIAVGLGANFWFGGKVNQQRRRARVRLFATGSLLNDRSLDPLGGVRLSQVISIIDDTRRFSWWPERGRWLSASFGPRQVVRIDGLGSEVHDLTADASWIHLWRIAHDHVIATSLLGAIVIPLRGEEEFRALTRAGGIGGLSGYSADEIFGKGTALLQAEYRHVYVNDLHLNILHLGYLRSIAGTVMTGVASVSSCDDLSGWFGRESWYTHVGYALGAHFFVFGVTPQLFRVEASVPLVRRRDTQCLGRTMPDYLAEVQGLESAEQLLPPFNINVTFQQTF